MKNVVTKISEWDNRERRNIIEINNYDDIMLIPIIMKKYMNEDTFNYNENWIFSAFTNLPFYLFIYEQNGKISLNIYDNDYKNYLIDEHLLEDVFSIDDVLSKEEKNINELCVCSKVLLDFLNNSTIDFTIHHLQNKNTTDYNYFDMSPDGKFTAIHKSRFKYFIDNNFWDLQLRKKYSVEIKPSKIISKITNDVSTEVLTNLNYLFDFKNLIKDYEIKVVKGEDIRKYYNEDTYDNDFDNTLQCSCMRYQSCQKYFDVYVDNKNIEMVCMFKNGKLRARALLWHTDEGINFLDRIYYSIELEYFIMTIYANKNNYYTKLLNQASYYRDDVDDYLDYFRIVSPEKDIMLKELTITLKNTSFDYLPYIDTFNILAADGKLKLLHTNSEYDIFEEYRIIYCDGGKKWRCCNCGKITYNSIMGYECSCLIENEEDLYNNNNLYF